MREGDWLVPLVRGVGALLAFAAGTVFARRWFRAGARPDEPFDPGVD